jgi:hypothetical protein
MKAQNIFDLEVIFISPGVRNEWWAKVVPSLQAIQATSVVPVRSDQIPDEKFRILEDGDGEIFVSLPDKREIKMKVSSGSWSIFLVHVTLSKEVKSDWFKMMRSFLTKKGGAKTPELFRRMPKGRGEIYIICKDDSVLSMTVPRGSWSIGKP